ncbi:MAG TPA: ectoine/hydroxyectoine ABC transporter substrate-binding protein EhuB [Acidimicrobiales bacterium]|nr:ectoine/hydroxyectoine ABC transporter substrate-binding protein EhuB [Acidimicrobiales bacterium]
MRTDDKARSTSGWTWVHIVGLMAVFAALLAGCGDNGSEVGSGDRSAEDCPAPDDGAGGLLAEARQQGFLQVGFANEVPYGYEGPDGKPTGQAPEVAREVLCRLGVPELRGTVVDFGGLIGGLNAGRYDMIAAGMFINPERAAQVSFTDPDYCGTTAFAVAEGNPLGLTDFESVTESEARLGVMNGAVEDEYAVDSGVSDSQISRFSSTPDLFDALRAGRIDAVALTEVTVQEQVKDLPGFEATEGFVPVIDGEEQLGCGGYAFRKENQELRDRFNEVLNEMKQNDEILPIIEQFGFSEASVEKAKETTVEDLL